MDPRTSVKNLAITCLVSLYDVFGESMLEELMQNNDIKQSQIQAVKDAISYKNTHSDALYLQSDIQNHHIVNNAVNITVNYAKYGQESGKGRDDGREEVLTVPVELADLPNHASATPLSAKAGQGQSQGQGQGQGQGLSRTRDLSAPKRNPVNRLALTSTYMHVHCYYVTHRLFMLLF